MPSPSFPVNPSIRPCPFLFPCIDFIWLVWSQVTGLCVCIYYFVFSVHPFIHRRHPHGPCVCFLFPPQRFIHPSEHPVLSIPFVGMIIIVAVVWCWLSELASQRARYGRSLSLPDLLFCFADVEIPPFLNRKLLFIFKC